MSYDPVEVLRDFADEHGISFPLLSDDGSDTIRVLGLENTDLEAQNTARGRETLPRHRGLPYPGTFRLDADGVVIDKWFEASHRVRPSASAVLPGLLASGAYVVATHAEQPGISAVLGSSTTAYRAHQWLALDLVLDIAPGHHVYVPPVPDGFTALTVTVVDGPVSETRVALPRGEPFTVEGLEQRFQVIEGTHRLPVHVLMAEEAGPVALRVRVDHQVCTASTCLPPGALELTVQLDQAPTLRPPSPDG